MPSLASDLAERLGATRQIRLPPLSLQRPPPWRLLACGRHPQHARPLALRPLARPRGRPGRRRQLDRRRDRRIWRSPRHHPPRARSASLSGRCRRSPQLPQPALRHTRAPTVGDRERRARPPRDGSLRCRKLFPEALPKPIFTDAASFSQRRRNGFASIPHCYYRPDDGTPRQSWPALIAAVTDLEHHITGVHRTWLDPDGFDPHRLGKAPVAWPKRAMGDLLGHAVRYGVPDDVLTAGEGLETTLSIASAAPTLPVAAALSSAHLAAVLLPATVRRLYIAQDRDTAGRRAPLICPRAPCNSAARRCRFCPAARISTKTCAAMASTLCADRSRRNCIRTIARVSCLPKAEPAPPRPKLRISALQVAGKGSGLRDFAAGSSGLFLDRRRRAHRPKRGATLRQAARAGNGCGRLFSVGGQARLYIAKQNSRPSPSSTSFRPFAALRVQARSSCRRRRPSAAIGAVFTTEDDFHDEPSRRNRLRTRPRRVSDRSGARRTAALWLPPPQRRTRPAPASRSPTDQSRPLRCLRRPRRRARRYPP